MKKPKKFAVGGYTQKPTGPAKPMGPIMGPKSTDGSGVMSGLRSMASSLKPNMVTEKPNMGPNASTNQTQGSPLKGFSAGFDPTKPRPVSSGKLYPLQGSISPVKGPTATPVGLKPQIMGGSSNKMGPDSMKTGVPANPANMSIAKPPGLNEAARQRLIAEDKLAKDKRTHPIPISNAKPTAPKNDVGIGKFMQDQVNKPRAMLKTGGAVKASKRGDGIAQRGKTKCRMV